VVDSAGISTTNSFALTINAAPLMITTTSPLNAAVLNEPYSQTLAASGGTPPYTWSVVVSPRTGEGLPDGFTLSTDGVLSGTLTNSNIRAKSFEVQVADSRNVQAVAFFTLPVESLLRRIEQVKLSGGQISFQFTVQYGQTNVVQFRGPLQSGDWTTLTNVTVPATTNVMVTDSIADALRFYRFQILTSAPKK